MPASRHACSIVVRAGTASNNISTRRDLEARDCHGRSHISGALGSRADLLRGCTVNARQAMSNPRAFEGGGDGMATLALLANDVATPRLAVCARCGSHYIVRTHEI